MDIHDHKKPNLQIVGPGIKSQGGGSNQSRVRMYNERLVLSIVRRNTSLSKAHIAKLSGLSPQAVTVIMRSLESDGLLLRGQPQRGKVGQPSIPMSLDPEGAFSIGLKIGYRHTYMLLVDFLGNRRAGMHLTYDWPDPNHILEFVSKTLPDFEDKLDQTQRQRIAGLGLSIPTDLWENADKIGAPHGELDIWRTFDFEGALSLITDHPVFRQNDTIAACGAELAFGSGYGFSDFIYIFIGTLVGGGIVLNHSVYAGPSGKAGTLGSMPVNLPGEPPSQLVDHASLFKLENELKNKGLDAGLLCQLDADWDVLGDVLQHWIDNAAKYLAIAVTASCTVIDFQAVIIEGSMPNAIRSRLVAAVRSELANNEWQGITTPPVVEGKVGRGARAVGAASLPLLDRYLLDQSVLFKELE